MSGHASATRRTGERPVQFWVGTKLHAQFRQAVQAEGRNMAWTFRRFMEDYVESAKNGKGG